MGKGVERHFSKGNIQIVTMPLKSCSAVLTGEVQSSTTVRRHCRLISWLLPKPQEIIRNRQGYGDGHQVTRKNSRMFAQEMKNRTSGRTHWSDLYGSQRTESRVSDMTGPRVHSGVIRNSQTAEAAQVCANKAWDNSTIKRKEILTEATTWLTPEDMLSQTPEDKMLQDSSYMKNLGESN